MSECPAALIVAKPRRRSWALEEAWDLAVLADVNGYAVETRFPGVIAVYASIDPRAFSRIAYRTSKGFIQRIVPAVKCLNSPSREELGDAIASILAERGQGRGDGLRVIVSLRGEGKRIADDRLVYNLVRSLGLRVDKASRTVLDVESVDETFIVSAGITRPCGNSCIIVYVE